MSGVGNDYLVTHIKINVMVTLLYIMYLLIIYYMLQKST